LEAEVVNTEEILRILANNIRRFEYSKLDEFDQTQTEESLGSLIGNELRSGEVDFRRAIILTEIIRPVYNNK
jgi:hypothetical protein